MLEDIIATLTAEEAAALDEHITSHDYPRGAIILEQFSIPTGIHIVTEGKVRLFELTVLAKNLCALQLADLSAPEPILLGETSILMGQLCSCTVVAATDVKSITIPLDAYNELKTSDPNVALKIMDYMAKVLAFRYLNMQEKFESRIVGSATNPHTALALLKKYVGNVRVCTPNMAKKLFNIDNPIV
ncbi:MAG: cyclic nucleotide-binding domain-containing protein [Alphaproteobacteria bacterium]|nr:cyclic nucleotide-binding domain-containing protein [Alphaproteobacteria bacterium]MDD9920225.1 cyclic nucleotide-binding domain-containing protein [Alphaproteobacteria bacterium]